MSRRKSSEKNEPRSIDWRSYFSEDPEEAERAIQLLTLLRSRGPDAYRDYLGRLNRSDRRRVTEVLIVATNLEASRSLEAFARHVRTRDEHKHGEESTRPFPTREEKPYVWNMLDAFQVEPIWLIEKSRQLMVTWECCLYALWVAKYQKNRLVFIQSKKEESAANLVFNADPTQARISFMETNLPEELRSKVTWSYGRAIFTETGSSIQAIPEGGDQIRSYTPSLVISDEIAFQPEFEAAWSAIKPCIDGGGQFIGVSTANSGAYMRQLIKATLAPSVSPMKGVKHYVSDSGIPCMRVHYTADPEKDPATEAGAKWLERALKGYPGGVKASSWRREMEIDWDATGGELAFPQLTEFEHMIVIPPHEIPESWSLYGSFDYGHRNPSSFHVYAIDHDGNITVIWEYYMAGQGYRRTARTIRGCPFFDKLAFPPIADPSIWAKNQQQAGGDDNDMKSVAQLFFELPDNERILFVPGKRGGDITVAEKINGDMWNEEELRQGRQPRLRIFSTCPMMIWELKKLRYRDYTAIMQETHNIKEELVDRDNHSYDDLKMFVTMFFSTPQSAEEAKLESLRKIDPVSYAEWKAVAERFSEGRKAESGLGEFA